MTLASLGFRDLDIFGWFRGLVAAFISGGASAVSAGLSVGIVDPDHFNVHEGLRKILEVMFAMFLIDGIKSMGLFLHQTPVPDFKTIKTTVQETGKPDKPPTTVVRTVEEVHVEKQDPKTD